jgi:hypothetical protein
MILPSLLAAAVLALPQQPQDTTYERLIREATTDPRFLPASVTTIPSSATLPSPLKYFGTIAGAPGVVHHAEELYAYYRALADASPRVRVETVGRTEEGREILLVVIADSAAMGRLGEIKRGLAALADPRTTDHAAMERLVGRIEPVYYIQGGLHSAEMGPPEMLTELAYRLAASEDSAIARIRRDVVVVINPVAEPDGRDRQVDWYYRYTKGRPDPADGFPRSAPYWGKYAFHDNNRDGLQMALALTRAIHRVYYAWHPLVMHDLHESVPLLYVSTGTGPYNPTIDPITRTEWLTLANWDVQHVTQQGLPGVWTWAFFDGWWPGYAVWVANNHNEIGRFYETFGNAGADTELRDLRGQTFAGDSVTSEQWYRQWPPTKKVFWSMRDNTNYSEAGVLAALDYAAQNRREMLANFWQKGYNSIERGKTEAPYGYLIPPLAGQRDPRRAAYLVNQLLRKHIEVQRATDTLAGSFVIRLDQPYRDLAVNLLERQHYPQSAKYPPYDDISWTLGLLYGVNVEAINDSSVFTWRGLVPVTDTVTFVATPTTGPGGGSSTIWLLRYRGQEELLPALYALKQRESRATVAAAESTFTAADTTWDAGTVIFDHLSAGGATWLGQQYGLPLVQAPAPAVRSHALDLPRIAIYHTWYSTQDEGWARYWFEQLGIPYTDISKDELRRGDLRRHFDVILVPNAGGDANQWVHGVDAKWSPLPYTRTDRYPAHGFPASTGDMTGGPGFEGLAQLQRFLDEGGTVIALENAARLVAETGLVRQLRAYQPRGLFHPASLVTAKARRPDDPIMYGFPETTHVFRGNGPLWSVARRDRGLMVLQYGTEPLPDERDTVVTDIMGMPRSAAPAAAAPRRDGGQAHEADAGHQGHDQPYVLSGMVRDQQEIIGQGAIFDVPAGTGDAGRVVVFTFNPLNRFLNHHDAPLLFNAMLNWNDGKP